MFNDISEQSSVITSGLRPEDAEFALLQPDTTPRPKLARKKPLSKCAARHKAQHAKNLLLADGRRIRVSAPYRSLGSSHAR